MYIIPLLPKRLREGPVMSDIFYSRARFLNFGDDLNIWLWPRVVPKFFAQRTDYLLIGTGTILGDRIPSASRRYVMGSGAGYGAVPRDLSNGSWRFMFVRGPLTAKVLDLPADAAVTDGAMLLPQYLPASGLRERRTGPIFIPHWKSALQGEWPEVCQMAGVRYVSPMQPLEEVMSAIVNASLVLTESMHGAILADAYRVPWIPLRTTPEVNDFKWTDWCASMGVEYRPECIPPSGLWDQRRAAAANNAESHEAFASSIRNDIGIAEEELQKELVCSFNQRYGSGVVEATPRRPDGLVSKLASDLRVQLSRALVDLSKVKGAEYEKDRRLKEAAAIAIIVATSKAPFLSVDAVLTDRTSQMQERVQKLLSELI